MKTVSALAFFVLFATSVSWAFVAEDNALLVHMRMNSACVSVCLREQGNNPVCDIEGRQPVNECDARKCTKVRYFLNISLTIFVRRKKLL